MTRYCSVDGCDKVHDAKGLCNRHYAQQYPTSRERQSWNHMKSRCYNINNIGYNDYGGRGIIVCNRWKKSFNNFLEDMGNRPDGKSLDRIDNNGDYEPNNCKWSDKFEQARNKRPSRLWKSSTSGEMYITWDKSRNKWHLQVKRHYIGRYKEISEAIEERNKYIRRTV